jgi:serine/threonine-protein kinase
MAVLAALGVLAVIALGVGLYLSQRDNGEETPTAAVVAMPDLDGLSEDEAQDELEKLKFSSFTATPAKTTDDCGETPRWSPRTRGRPPR